MIDVNNNAQIDQKDIALRKLSLPEVHVEQENSIFKYGLSLSDHDNKEKMVV